MAGMALVLCLLPMPQDASGAVGRFAWPPDGVASQLYRVELKKERKLDKELAQAERAARKDAGLHAPGRAPRQKVEMTIDVKLAPAVGAKGAIVATYTTKLDRGSLRWKLVDADATAPGPPLGNTVRTALWGLPHEAKAKPLEVPRDAIERTFEHTFEVGSERTVDCGDFPHPYGDHLIPVLWRHPLPCWIGMLTWTLDLDGVAVVEGKSLIRDRNGNAPLGPFDVRAKLMFTKGSTKSFAFEYEMTVKQRMDRTRDHAERELEPFFWLFDIKGEATYSLVHRAFTEIDETVTARIDEPTEERMCKLHDEVFVGAITVRRVDGNEKEEKRRRRRR